MKKKAFVVCHMMASVDGRIDCDMTEQIGGDGYYKALAALNVDTTVEGKVTALKHYAEKQPFVAEDKTPVGKEDVFKACDGTGWEVVADTHGTLRWPDSDTPSRVCLVSEDAPKEYLDYLRGRGTSYIATGKGGIDLARAVEILADVFGFKRIGVVGGGHVNGGFLCAGLLDEVSVVIGAAIDGREGFASVFDGIEASHTTPYKLHLMAVEQMADESVWLRYKL